MAMIILEVELMDPEDPSFQENVKDCGGTLLRQLAPLREAIPGDGVICLYALPNLACAHRLCGLAFGDGKDWDIKIVVEDVMFRHVWR